MLLLLDCYVIYCCCLHAVAVFLFACLLACRLACLLAGVIVVGGGVVGACAVVVVVVVVVVEIEFSSRPKLLVA